jgi:cation:H+ antiporter
MLLNILFFVLGFVLLISGANFLINGSVALGKKHAIPSIVVGMVIVGFGTSLPELIISVVAVLKNSVEISISNAVGSNIANIMIVLGILSLISKVDANKHTRQLKIPFIIIASIILFFVSNDRWFFEKSENIISLLDGIIFLLIFIGFLLYSFFIHKEEIAIEDNQILKSNKYIVFSILFGLLGICFGGDWVVDNAIVIAREFGISESFIGVSILAVGSSLPEIISSVAAALKKESGIAIGNIIGSNIFNTFLIIGVASLIRPLPVSDIQQFNIYINILASVLFLVFVISGKFGRVSKVQGLILLLMYIAFMIISLQLGNPQV